MSCLAFDVGPGYLTTSGSPPAGDEGGSLMRAAIDAFNSVKKGVTAGSSWVFDDLHALAAENECNVREEATFTLALRFLLALPGDLPAPELSLDEDGEMAFDWRAEGPRLLHASLREDGRISYACWLGPNNREHGTKAFVDAIPEDIVRCIQRVAAHR